MHLFSVYEENDGMIYWILGMERLVEAAGRGSKGRRSRFA